MKLYFVLCLCVVLDFVYAKVNTNTRIQYLTKPNKDITIKIMFHIDKALTNKLSKEYKTRSRGKLKMITHNILEDARKLFDDRNFNETIKLKLMHTKFLKNNQMYPADENASTYLKNYCDFQSRMKVIKKELYFSVLMTGIDIFNINNGKTVKANSGRGYTRGMCSLRKSCALLEWDKKNIGFLLAHEIGHSLGMNHDGPPYNHCKDRSNIMALRYHPTHHSSTWSPCSIHSLKKFLILKWMPFYMLVQFRTKKSEVINQYMDEVILLLLASITSNSKRAVNHGVLKKIIIKKHTIIPDIKDII